MKISIYFESTKVYVQSHLIKVSLIQHGASGAFKALGFQKGR